VRQLESPGRADGSPAGPELAGTRAWITRRGRPGAATTRHARGLTKRSRMIG